MGGYYGGLRVHGKVCEVTWQLKIGICSSDVGEIFSGPLGVTVSIIVWPDTSVIWSQGCRNTETRKENKTGNEVTCIVDKLLIHGDADKSHLGFCNISWSNRNSTRQLEVHSNIHSCGYRGQYGCPRLRCWSLIGKSSGSCLYFTEPIGSHA